MTVKTWVCHICGDPYIGEGKPTHCPFCGAPEKYMVEGSKYKEPVVGKLSETSTNNIYEAIKLEVSNAEFYFCASRKAALLEHQKRFKALGKVESEHATLLCKLVGAESPKIDRNAGTCKGDDAAFNKEAHDRESKAIAHYAEFAKQATEQRVKQVFNALVEIESTHLELAEKGG
ncbi:ferritin [Candidatus Woesearchaeota archaeon]|nr:ferritin [Candidatus Woesearchaeota archaeon]